MSSITNSKQKDSRSKSLSEAFVNSFGGYPIGYGIGVINFFLILFYIIF